MRWYQMKRSRWAWAAAALFAPVLLFCGAAFVGSHSGVNEDWRPDPDGITIYLVDNGVHTGIVLPVLAAGVDLRTQFRASDLPDARQAGSWLIFGWGDRQFYLETPQWSDVRPMTVLVAAFGSGQSLLHVDHIDGPEDLIEPRPISISRGEYRKLVGLILATRQRGSAAVAGYGPRDVFYPANGRYSMVRTCNVWTGDTLAAAGIRAPLWSPFSGGVMHWFRWSDIQSLRPR
jgi:uncharacterized protein (TIGR02117 family)